MTYSGEKIKELRLKQNISREELCGDETELSVRQLARIESDQSMPTLGKLLFIANKLNISIGELVDNDKMELPERYKELKYLILRTPTYKDSIRLNEREQQLNEILNTFYDELPEEEKLMIDCIQASFEVFLSKNINFGIDLWDDYFDQVIKKQRYTINDFILIELYFTCILASSFDETVYDSDIFDNLVHKLLKQENYLSKEDLFILTKLLLRAFYIAFALGKTPFLEPIIETSQHIMETTREYQNMPMLKLIEWKYALFHLNHTERAKTCFQKAISFADLIDDPYLKQQLEEEWNKDNTWHFCHFLSPSKAI